VTSDGVREEALPSKAWNSFAPYRDGVRTDIGQAAPKRPAQWLRNSAILFSFCLHAAVGLSLFDWSGADEQFGTLADKTDAISMATEQTLVLESIETETVQAAASASAASQAGSVQSAESVPQPLTETKEAVEATEPPPEPVDVAEATPSAAAPTDDPLPVIRGGAAPDEVSETKTIQTSETVKQVKPTEVAVKDVTENEEQTQDVDKSERQVTAQAASRASAAGSTTSRSSTAQSAISGRVSASRGNVLNYAARIRTVLARHKPAGDGHRGTARISFGLTSTGDLSYVQVASSSGRANLDKAAMAAVRQAAPFGQPPADVSPNQLRFTIPFYFR
jgi:protein TonB